MLVFYERFIEIKTIEDEVSSLEISEEEKNKLLFTAAEIFHHHTIETILNRLDEDSKKRFLEAAESNSDINMISLLKEKMSDYEKILKEKLTSVRDEIISEVRKVKND